MMISEEYRLKKFIALYLPFPTQLHLTDDNQHHSTYTNHQGLITLGTKAPYRYIKTFHPEGYHIFLEGLLFHEIARLLYTDFLTIQNIFASANKAKNQMSEHGRLYANKIITLEQCQNYLLQDIETMHLPFVLLALEDGAIENHLGKEHPETWNALMYARQGVSQSFITNKQDALITQVIKEISLISTYGYRYSIQKYITVLPSSLPQEFEHIRKLAIQGRLLTSSTSERVIIAEKILQHCYPIFNNTIDEIIDTIDQTSITPSLSQNLFDGISEIAVSFSQSESTNNSSQQKATYHIDISDEEFQRTESLENQEERNQQHQLFQDIYKREQETKKKEEQDLHNSIDEELKKEVVFTSLQTQQPTYYGQIALKSKNQSITRSNHLAQLLKREIMYASKSHTRHKREYGKQLDQPYLYRASLDGRVFKEYHKGKKKDLCIAILVDNSESMNGDRIINAMKGCYELSRVLQTLSIPFCIYTHKAIDSSTIQMMKLIPFEDCKKRHLLERIFMMHASGGTHEDIALKQTLRDLSLYQRQKKGFVFVLSDGDTHGVSHIHQLTELYKKQYHIDVVGIGIHTKQIQRTYPQHIYIEDLKSLPEELIKKLKELALGGDL